MAGRLRIETRTVVAFAAALTGVVSAWWSGLRRADEAPAIRDLPPQRIFRELAAIDEGPVRVLLSRPGGVPIEVTVEGRRYDVRSDGVWLGPGDPAAIEALISTLVAVEAERELAPDVSIGPVEGVVALQIGTTPEGRDGVRFTLEIGAEVAGGRARYAAWSGPNGRGQVVVGEEVSSLLDTPARAWLWNRVVPVEVGDVVRAEEDGRVLERHAEGFYVATQGSPGATRTAFWSEAAVRAHLDRTLLARVLGFEASDPDRASSATPWLRIKDTAGHEQVVFREGACRDTPRALAITLEGGGLVRCADASMPQAVPPLGSPEGLALVLRRLLPVPPARVLAVHRRHPEPRSIVRRGAGFVVTDPSGRESLAAEPEVHRFLTAWHDAVVRPRVDLAEDVRPANRGGALDEGRLPGKVRSEYRFAFELDSASTLEVDCGRHEDGRVICRLGADGMPLEVDRPDELDFSFGETSFEPDALVSVPAHEIRGLEILIPPGAPGVRQSVSLDQGVWRLGAPITPLGVEALDGTRLEGLLEALAGLRSVPSKVADPRPSTASGLVREFRLELAPRRDRARELSLGLHEDCTVTVSGRAGPARLSTSDCEVLKGDVLFVDPARALLRLARRAVVERLGGGATGSHEIPAPAHEDGSDPWKVWLAGFRATQLVAADHGGPPQFRLIVVTSDGRELRLLGARDWVGFEEAAFRYAGAAPRALPMP